MSSSQPHIQYITRGDRVEVFDPHRRAVVTTFAQLSQPVPTIEAPMATLRVAAATVATATTTDPISTGVRRLPRHGGAPGGAYTGRSPGQTGQTWRTGQSVWLRDMDAEATSLHITSAGRDWFQAVHSPR
eukprot:COSAG01_NODE_272_length_19747_cov_298.524023_17_plen_130_part_00